MFNLIMDLNLIDPTNFQDEHKFLLQLGQTCPLNSCIKIIVNTRLSRNAFIQKTLNI